MFLCVFVVYVELRWGMQILVWSAADKNNMTGQITCFRHSIQNITFFISYRNTANLLVYAYLFISLGHMSSNFIIWFTEKADPPTQVYFGMLDALMASEVLPEEYRNRCQVSISLSYLIFFWPFSFAQLNKNLSFQSAGHLMQ